MVFFSSWCLQEVPEVFSCTQDRWNHATFITDGTSKYDDHVWSELSDYTYLADLFISMAVVKSPMCATCSELPCRISTVDGTKELY